MASLFSAFVIIISFASLCALCFCIARVFLPSATARRVSIIFPCGATIGGVLATLALAILFDDISAVQSLANIALCFIVLAIGLLLGGAIPTTLFLRHTLHSKPHPLQADPKE